MNLYKISRNGQHIGNYVGSGKWDGINAALWVAGLVEPGHMTTPQGTRIVCDAQGVLELVTAEGVDYRSEFVLPMAGDMNEGWQRRDS